MREVLAEANEEHHPLLLEIAVYWLALGITLGWLPSVACRRWATSIAIESAS
jgi:hypothetical protein